MRVVLDTSVLITALRSSQGAAAETVRLALRQELTLLMDFKMACEYRDVALRQDHLIASGRSQSEVEDILNALEAIAQPIYVAFRHRPLSADPNDDLILDVALNGRADALVTGNTRHFLAAANRFHLPVFTPSELLLEIAKRRSSHA